MTVLMNSEIPVSQWEDFHRSNDHSSPFQSPAFYHFFSSLKTISTAAIAVTDGSMIRALAVLTVQQEKGIAGFFSKRGIIYGGPLVDENYPQALDMLLQKITELPFRGVIYTEVRNLSDFSYFREVFFSNGYKYIPFLNFRVDTLDGELMQRRISSSRLRQIKKAQKQSVTCLEAGSLDQVMIFYGLLKALYRDKLHKPLPAEEFFINFFKAGLGPFLLVVHEGKIIGGIMCPVLCDRALYEFYVCGLDEDYKELYPSVMATWFAMEYANRNSLQLFDFMGAGKSGESYGVRDFKARFGGEMVEFGRFLNIRKPLFYILGETGLRLMKFFSK